MLTVLNTFSIYMSKQNIEVQMKALEVYKTQWATGNNYVKMGIPNHVNYMIQTVESQMGNSPSNSKDIELQKAFVKELKNYLESIEPNK